MKNQNKNLVIIIFPYLFIYEREGFEINKLKIKPSYKENVENEEEQVKKHLLNIAKLFRFGRSQQIFQGSYTFTKVSNTKQWEHLKNELNKLTTILRFSQLSDLKEHSSFEHFNYFVFEITGEQLAADNDFAYYRGILNGESSFNFYFLKGAIHNPYIPQTELHPLVLTVNQIKKNNYFKTFYFYKNFILKNDEDRKILRAMEWFNRSYSHYGRGVDLSEAVLNVHTAFEALLRPEDEERGVKAQIKTALLNILGHSKELGLWFDEFWKLRNSIVHGDITPEPFLYIPSKGKKGYRHHLYIARKIFVKCLNTILKIRSDFPLLGLEEELISNEVRVNNVIKILKKQKSHDLERIYKTGVLELISGLRSDDISADKIRTKKLGELFLPFVKKDLENNEKQDIKQNLIETINKILEWQGNNLSDLALLYSKLRSNYHFVYFNKKIDLPLHVSALRKSAYDFLNFITWRLLTMFD
jgi:hypothetical protein